MPRKKGFDKMKQQQALSRVAQGFSYEAVGEEFGVARDTIYRLVKNRSHTGRTVVSRGKSFHIRLNEDEMNALKAFCVDGEFRSNADAHRALLRSTQGFLECSRKAQSEFEILKRQIEGIANNINQVAFAANRKDISLVHSQWEDVEELRAGLGAFSDRVNDVLDEMRRESVKLWRKTEYGRG